MEARDVHTNYFSLLDTAYCSQYRCGPNAMRSQMTAGLAMRVRRLDTGDPKLSVRHRQYVTCNTLPGKLLVTQQSLMSAPYARTTRATRVSVHAMSLRNRYPVWACNTRDIDVRASATACTAAPDIANGGLLLL